MVTSDVSLSFFAFPYTLDGKQKLLLCQAKELSLTILHSQKNLLQLHLLGPQDSHIP